MLSLLFDFNLPISAFSLILISIVSIFFIKTVIIRKTITDDTIEFNINKLLPKAKKNKFSVTPEKII